MMGNLPWWYRVLVWIFRPPAYRWHRGGPWWSEIRRMILHFVFRYESETCDRCGGRVGCVYHARDDLWEPTYAQALGAGRGDGGVLCPRCFGRASELRGVKIQWLALPLRLDFDEWRRVTMRPLAGSGSPTGEDDG